ncbi:MAG: phospholipase D family protein [archaeon]|nr:phospholipase D family protein [archaeon]
MEKKLAAILLLGLYFSACATQEVTVAPEVFFCPEDNCADHLIEKIDSATSTIDIAVYSFTHDEIADALIRAGERGVKVRVLVDFTQSQNKYSEDERLGKNGTEVKTVRKSGGIMHNKFIVIDGALVGTGSFNYSRNADESNDENLVFLSDAKTAKKYLEEFGEIWAETG